MCKGRLDLPIDRMRSSPAGFAIDPSNEPTNDFATGHGCAMLSTSSSMFNL